MFLFWVLFHYIFAIIFVPWLPVAVIIMLCVREVGSPAKPPHPHWRCHKFQLVSVQFMSQDSTLVKWRSLSWAALTTTFWLTELSQSALSSKEAWNIDIESGEQRKDQIKANSSQSVEDHRKGWRTGQLEDISCSRKAAIRKMRLLLSSLRCCMSLRNYFSSSYISRGSQVWSLATGSMKWKVYYPRI